MTILQASELPSRSKCLRTLKKVYPGAFFASVEGGGLELRYFPPGAGSDVPVLSVNGPRESALPLAVLCAAFARLGFDTSWRRGFPGSFDFKPIPGYTGPEDLIPVDLDPREPLTESKPEATVSEPTAADSAQPERPHNGH